MEGETDTLPRTGPRQYSRDRASGSPEVRPAYRQEGLDLLGHDYEECPLVSKSSVTGGALTSLGDPLEGEVSRKGLLELI